MKLFTDGDLPQVLLEEQRSELSRRRIALEAQRSQLESTEAPILDFGLIQRTLPHVVRRIREWVDTGDADRLTLLLSAVDARILASESGVQITGAIPLLAETSVGSDLATTGRTSGYTCSEDLDSIPLVRELSVGAPNESFPPDREYAPLHVNRAEQSADL